MTKKKAKAEIPDDMPGSDAAASGAAAETGVTAKTKAEARAEDETPRKLGTSKAVETMFRNAYRAELDTIALAATKANIMISLNGFIISALMISGAFIFSSSPGFLLPAGMFMVTAAASIIFALLSASPERADLFTSIWQWATAVRRGEARVRDLRGHVLKAREPADSDRINLLIYEDRVRLSRDEHWNRMQDLMRDRDAVYHSMSDQLYWLGCVADRKFRLLNVSYTVFRWGLLVSIIAFVALRLFLGILPSRDSTDTVRLRSLGIGTFDSIYEPSAVQQLPDGRLLVVEDEATRAMNVLTQSEEGILEEDAATGVRLLRGFGRKLSDLEGLTLDQDGYVYAITSHSLTNGGKRKPDREQLLRFRISGAKVGNISNVTNLRDTIAGDRQIAASLREQTGTDGDFDELNIEGLAYHRSTRRLYIGMRAPMVADRSMILVIENPEQMFEGKPPVFAEPILLDLRGGGIRALSYDPVLETFLIVNEIEGYENNRYSQLWSWSGDPAEAPEPIALPDIINLNNVESIDSITFHGVPQLLIMSDEGSEKRNEPARYMMLDYSQL